MKTGTNTMSELDIRAATAGVAVLRAKMTFVTPRSAAERREQGPARIGRKKLRALENRLAAARQHRDMLPPSFDLGTFERDTGLTAALGECLAAIDDMRDAVHDTLVGVAHRAIEAGSTAYAHIKVAATSAQSLTRTVEKMGTRGTSAVSREPAPVETPKLAEPSGTAPPAVPTVTPADKAA